MYNKKMAELHSKPPQSTDTTSYLSTPFPFRRYTLFALLSWCWTGILMMGCTSPPVPKGGRCIQSSDCQSQLKCIQQACSDGQTGSWCLLSTDCLTGYECIQQRCSPVDIEQPHEVSPTPETSPPDTEFLQSEVIAADGSSENSEYPEDNPDAPTETCQTHKDCPFQQHCLIQADGVSLRCSSTFPCQSDKDCQNLPGTVCRLHPDPKDGRIRQYCVHLPRSDVPYKPTGSACTQDIDCSSGLCLRDAQECGGFCQQSTDCPDGFYCGIYSLLRIGEFGGCYRDCREPKDCPPGYVCSSQGQCDPGDTPRIGRPCRQQSHCPTQGDCFDNWPGGYCVQSCTPTAQSCGQPQGANCPEGQDCLLDPETKQQRCTPVCPSGSQCVPFAQGYSYCLQSCRDHTQCRTDYFCATTTPKVCWPRGDRLLGNLCENPVDCATGMCRWLPTGKTCTQSCSDQENCPPRYICRNWQGESVCEKECSTNDDCPDEYQCLARQCQIPPNTNPREIGGSCTQHSQCRSGQCLQDNGFLPHGYCTQSCDSQTPCPTGSYCAQLGSLQLCLRTCQNQSDCGRKHYFCHAEMVRTSSQTTSIPCTSSKTCPNQALPWICHANQDGQFCALGFCLGRGVRQSGQLCADAWECNSGWCYLPASPVFSTACRSDQDCIAAFPFCDLVRKQCVGCLSSRHCLPGEICRQNACIQGGYCVDSCDIVHPTCPPQTSCVTLQNRQNQSLGSFCLAVCTSSLQCFDDFVCQPHNKTRVCRLR